MNDKQTALLVDIDGVLTHVPHMEPSEFTWDKFSKAVDEDSETLYTGVELVKTLREFCDVTIFLTARPEALRGQTGQMLQGLFCNSGQPATLVMCPDEFAEAQICENYKEVQATIKRAALNNLVSRFNVELAIDDQEENCIMYREFGIKTIKVNLV